MQYTLGKLFMREEFMDIKKAVEWLTKSAEQGYSESQYNLGSIYYLGAGEIVKQNYEIAIKWFTKAAIQNHVQAQYYLGLGYYTGEHTTLDYKKSFEWLTKSAKGGNVKAKEHLNKFFSVNGKEKPN